MEQGEHRDQLLAMAQTWEHLAAQSDITAPSDYPNRSSEAGGMCSSEIADGVNGSGSSN